MILFLDIDGVLHPEPCYDKSKLFLCLPRLEHVLREFNLVQIVISSTWRETRSLSDLREFFSPDIAERVFGVTPNWRDVPELVEIIGYQRHAEIEGWLRQSGSPWQPWVAIDDKPYLFRPFLKNLVKTNSSAGFDTAAEKVLRKKLICL
ncbi:MAG: HAD domain-containing protein [Undibacterium sp.]|uniref:HAD domain-containing protein n=1 Tax=Undibacterium sp. TaxID=1914977 RepID=UPI00271DE0C8|nr:HAD domain-containing protein [Undibacterium sp.]MDO8653473.1 HAD domain-containing protein [Undibacterium sp.]